jgi:hypothetical protein
MVRNALKCNPLAFRQYNENAQVLRNLFLSRKLRARNIHINPIVCEPFVASGISYPSMIITMKKNCPMMKEVKISLCRISDPLKKGNLSFRYPVPLNCVFSIFGPPPLYHSFLFLKLFSSSIAVFMVPNWGI